MNVVFITNQGKALSFDAGQWRVTMGLLLLFALLCAAAWTGYRFAQKDELGSHGWHHELDQQKQAIDQVRQEAGDHLDALVMRMGRMQAEVLRLEALGQQLVARASLDKDEFDFSSPPPLGGPHAVSEAQQIRPHDFMQSLDALSQQIRDRENKLLALESLIMDRNLTGRVVPDGRPVAKGWLSSYYGKRTDPLDGSQEFHKGVDIAGKEGSEIMAVGDGVVSWAGIHNDYGNLLEITHGNGYVTRYAHNKQNLVSIGDTVKKGQTIALMGSTGRATGPHVHFEVVRKGKTENPSKYFSDSR